MKIILLSGGSGKRLWPLSNGSRTKQFLKVLRGVDGEKESMVQRVWRQLQEAGLASSTYIATCSSQVDLIKNQIGDHVPLIVEPERRDTFPAIALVSAYLNSIACADKDEIVCVLPVDPYVDTVFFDKVKELERVLNDTGAEVALIGSKPTYPSGKYGYIVSDPAAQDGLSSSIVIDRFVEKPSEDEAERLIEAGALWNCGIFAFKLHYLLTLLKARSFPVTYQELSRQYARLPKRSFDYEVLEKAQQLRAIVYESGWKDLGTWNTLTEEMDTKLIGRGLISEDSVNTHVLNELDILITVLGLSNVIVAAGPNGILVADKAASPRIKELMQPIDERLMYEELRWGWYRILDLFKLDGDRETLVKKVVVHTGEQYTRESKPGSRVIWTVQAGKGVAIIEGKPQTIAPGDCLEMDSGVASSAAALTELTIVEVQIGNAGGVAYDL
jgi:mannose-1-phosphate guanylyltransferase